MSKRIEQFYFDKDGVFRGLLYEIHEISSPRDKVSYDPTTAKLTIDGIEYDTGSPYWENDDILLRLDSSNKASP